MAGPTLQTERLLIRPLGLNDWEAYAEAWSDPRIFESIGIPPRTRAENWLRFSSIVGLWELLGYGYLGFFDAADKRFLGNGGVMRAERGIPQLTGYPEAGWALIADSWGKGFATEAMQAMLGWADGEALGEIRCIIDPPNIASQRVAAKLGFRQIGESRNDYGELLVFSRSTPE